MSVARWLLSVAVAVDQTVNAILGGNPDETISSRAEKARQRGDKWGCVLCRILDRIDPGHCARSVEWDEK